MMFSSIQKRIQLVQSFAYKLSKKLNRFSHKDTHTFFLSQRTICNLSIGLLNKKHHYYNDVNYSNKYFLPYFMIICMLGLSTANSEGKVDITDEQKSESSLPYYSKLEVSMHKNKTERIWVTYKDGVYDITDFVDSHPGGSRILLASGGPIDHYWMMYSQHNTKQVLDILSEYRIGTLFPHEIIQNVDIDDPYANEPVRAPLGSVRCEKPFNSETVIELIPENYITPEIMHYKRHHHPVPDMSPNDFSLKIGFENDDILELSYKEICELFKKNEITATLQCAGNRRSELNAVRPVQGLDWDCGAISTSVWGGALLSDILKFSGIEIDSPLVQHKIIKHVGFCGLDEPYDASIPIEKALSKFGDVLVAYEMNGKPIPREHGGPVRIIVPGHLAARSVKWTHRIFASKNEAISSWQRGVAYKAMGQVKQFNGIDPNDYSSIQELPVNSAICNPRPGDEIDYENESINVQGWAWAGGGRNIIRVEVSCDNGLTWEVAELKEGKNQPIGRAWAWTLWEKELKLRINYVNLIQKLKLYAVQWINL